MTFVADVKSDWQPKLPSITHQDGTGRLQTVTRWQNEAIYDLITEFEKVAGHGVILNTSFNDNGKPILTRYSDALNLLRNTKLDAVYVHEKKLIIFKSGDEKRFKKSLEAEGSAQISLETTVNVLAFAKDDAEMETFLDTIQKLSKKVERLTVVSSQEHGRMVVEKFKNQPHVKSYPITHNRHYYNTMIHDRTLGSHPEVDINSTYYFSLFVKPLWVKEVLRDNVFDTKYHVFIDLSLMEDNYNYNVVRDIKMLTEAAKIEDEVVGMTAFKAENHISIFDNEFLQKRFKFTPEFHPYPYIFYGNLEGVEWFSNNYEGMILWYMPQDKIGDLADYSLVSYAENQHRYNFIELEKHDTEA
jgi:hypothetical protein